MRGILRTKTISFDLFCATGTGRFGEPMCPLGHKAVFHTTVIRHLSPQEEHCHRAKACGWNAQLKRL
jgi:hypothetical protein